MGKQILLNTVTEAHLIAGTADIKTYQDVKTALGLSVKASSVIDVATVKHQDVCWNIHIQISSSHDVKNAETFKRIAEGFNKAKKLKKGDTGFINVKTGMTALLKAVLGDDKYKSYSNAVSAYKRSIAEVPEDTRTDEEKATAERISALATVKRAIATYGALDSASTKDKREVGALVVETLKVKPVAKADTLKAVKGILKAFIGNATSEDVVALSEYASNLVVKRTTELNAIVDGTVTHTEDKKAV